MTVIYIHHTEFFPYPCSDVQEHCPYCKKRHEIVSGKKSHVRLTKVPMLVNGFSTACAMHSACWITIWIIHDVAFVTSIVEPIGDDEAFFINPWCSKNY